ncbi:MAG: hypothetical protein ABWY29_11330 [Blastococcus sp.]
MTEVFDARSRLDALRRDVDDAQALADEALAVVRRLQDARDAQDPRNITDEQVATTLDRHDGLQRHADDLRAALNDAEERFEQTLGEAAPLFDPGSTDPIALLPVRLETVWWNPGSLRVRVYPDDLHLSGFEPALTPDEAAAGAAYWSAPGPEARQRLAERIRPARAAWTLRATRPGAPPPVVRPDAADRAATTLALPARWRFVGIVDGAIVVDRLGRPVPDPLPLDLLRSEDGWAVDWFQALKSGMAIELNLPDGLDHLDQLVVVGVRGDTAEAGAAWLRDLLLGHAYGAGLDLLRSGTPTNNTARTRSGWSSRPTYPAPEDQPADGRRVADDLATALGLADAGFLRDSPGAEDPEPDAVAALSLLTWPTLGKGFAEASVTHLRLADPPVRQTTDSARRWRGVRDHLAAHVRSRGPLPILRAGRQPYGVLPATSLSDWRAERDRDVDALLVPWLRRLRNRWQSVLDVVPRVLPGQPVDQAAMEVLNRLPVSTGLAVRWMNGPGTTVPRTPLDEPPAQLGVPGLAPDGVLRWTTNSDTWIDQGWGLDDATGVPLFVPLLMPGPAFLPRLLATADHLRAVQAFLAGEQDAAAYDSDWPVLRSDGEPAPRRSTLWELPPDSGLIEALLFLPNWAFMEGDEGDADPVREALKATGEVDQIVADVLDGISDPDRQDRIATAARWSGALAEVEQALRAVAAVPPARLPELLVEVVDVYTHRLDAWITSLATRRLAELRRSGSAGIRVGGYGWVEDVPPPRPREEVDLEGEDSPVLVSAQDGYIHAPSLQHAATAAVLRSGFLGHPGEGTFAVNLTSRRARTARWLLGGVRRGQSLGALLGYRFERALHDAGLDTEVDNFRAAFPAPVVPPPDGDAGDDLWARSAEAIAARNVVDGMALARSADPLAHAAEPDRVAPILAELVDALDAVGDLLLAESVHQLVGGSPLRAGLAADTLGRGGEVPDTFGVLRTPHRARALTHRVAAVLPAGPGTPTGWPADPVAELAPEVEAWVARLLGPAAGWTVTVRTREAPDDGIPVTADLLGLGALATVLDASSAEQARIRRALRNALAAAPDTPVTLEGPGWSALAGTAARIRTLLTTAQPLLPAHLPGEPTTRTVDLAGLRSRLAVFAADPLISAHPGAAEVVGLAAAPADARHGGTEGWLAGARAAVAGILGADVPLLPAVSGTLPLPRADAPAADVGGFLQRYADVRPVARTLSETLVLTSVRAGRGEPLHAAQEPADAGDAWIAGAFPADHRPRAGTHLVWHAPFALPAGTPLAGLLIDEWVELLPGSDQLREATGVSPAPQSPPESELTGVAFHYDRPDAKAPQSVLIAVPPDLDRGWTADILLQVVRETSELAKLRAIEVGDLPLLDDLLPAIRISPEGPTGNYLASIEENPRPGTDRAGPFRLETGRPESVTQVESGLAAHVHDPLWLLTRQWQFGEFTGQDAGSPAVVRLIGSSAPIDAWRPAGADSWTRYDIARGPLDAWVEAEPVQADRRMRADGGAHLLRLLDDAGLRPAAAGALAPHLLPAGDVGDGFLGLLGEGVPDAEKVAAAIDSGGLGAELGEVAARWRRWWADRVADRGPDSFDPHRFEHATEVSAGGTVLRAEEYLGDGLDWYSLDVDPDAQPAPAAERYSFTDEGLPSTVRYGGLPADRFWEMEDALVDLGAADVSTLDTGRLLLISFATVYGNDWFLVPLEVPAGSLTTLDRLLVRDVFGRPHLVERAGRGDPAWSMFTLHSPDPAHPAASGLVVVPTERGHVGEPLEQVGLARDELANLAWAVQHRYTDGDGERVERRDRWRPPVRPAPDPPSPFPAYGVQTVVPDYWFPLVPKADRPSVIHFHLADLADGGASRLEGRLLAPGTWVHEEEVPRDGVQLSRRPVLARWYDGSWHAWVRREKAPGTGESSSGLAFDTVRPTEPWPREA